MRGFLTVDILESDAEIVKRITKDIVTQINDYFQKSVPQIREITSKLLQEYIYKQPEYRAIVGQSSPLRYELGLITPTARLLKIINTLTRNISVELVPVTVVNNQFVGGIEIRGVISDYSDIINMSEAILVTERRDSLPWLEWMLLSGGNIVIGNYHVEFGNWGRTGGAIMVRGGSWGVPKQYAGTAQNNFITNAIAQMEPTLKREIINVLQ